ncbi:hypothetical protein AKJ16_DCAP10154, partial [Drosera capensis]
MLGFDAGLCAVASPMCAVPLRPSGQAAGTLMYASTHLIVLVSMVEDHRKRDWIVLVRVVEFLPVYGVLLFIACAVHLVPVTVVLKQ